MKHKCVGPFILDSDNMNTHKMQLMILFIKGEKAIHTYPALCGKVFASSC